ncbi:NAD(P)/FAD-dependent oxidoreductase [Pseudonocardia endophytica]|nr:FAD-dependent oxidoreductase [Pseudonocardia endophytica]
MTTQHQGAARPDRVRPRHRVVVLGAGYAGLLAAKRLAARVFTDEVEVTLVNASAAFVERPRLHQVATGQPIPAVELGALLAGTGVRLVVGTVTDLDLGARTVLARADGTTRRLGYDTLIYALGSQIDPDQVPGVLEHAHVLNDVAAADRLAKRLKAAGGSRVVVCGGGLTGIEVAAEIAESHPDLRVALVSADRPGGWLSLPAQRYLDRVMGQLGITVRAGTRVASVENDHMILEDGERAAADICVWAGGFSVPDLATRAGLEVTSGGRAVVDGSMRSRSHPEVYAIGDAAAISGSWGSELAMGCRTGGATGPKVADVVAAVLTGRPPAGSMRYRYVHECISLGRRRGLVQFLHADETPRDRILTGRVAMLYKNATLRGALLLFAWPGPYVAPRRHLAAAAR